MQWAKSRLKLVWNSIQEFYSTRLIANLTSHTKEAYERNFTHHYERAKRLSDFVGMIVRLAFATFAYQYFYRRATATEGFQSGVFTICYLTTLGLSIALGLRILVLILIYESTDIHKQTSKVIKVAMLIVSIIMTAALWYGVLDLVKVLANRSS
jgi:hypothetical protein